MAERLMSLRCDHCRAALGAGVQRYWQMRFCSPACVAAYRQRLDDATKVKIERLDPPVAETPRDGGKRWPNSVAGHLPGHFS
jgi:hypothetical protein